VSRRVSLPDFIGKEDENINAVLSESSDSEEKRHRALIKKTMMKIIENELTERQRQIIIMYYFRNMNIVSIADILGISPASVSVTMKRARNRIIRYMKYYL